VADPFDLQDDCSYASWRARKLVGYPAAVDDLRVEVRRLAAPSPAERAAIRARVADFNLALICTDPRQVAPPALLAFGLALGLRATDANPFADAQAVSAIAAGAADDRAEYIPYTDRPLCWHTDGYYNAPEAQVRAWILFCLRPAARGGETALLDHEIAYLRLRDQSPGHIAALSHPQALTIPANVQDGRTLRAASVGPVFAVRDGFLHMRYSARRRHVQWRGDQATQAARSALDRLFSSEPIFTFRHRLQAGEGVVSNNVLHDRAGFEDQPGAGRLLYRVRYRDRLAAGDPD
jgi:alpha-ketoglutarate-dependent taurine dioxygenase